MSSSTSKFLPAFSPGASPHRPKSDGGWHDASHGTAALLSYAESLDLLDTSPAVRLRSLPSPWARLLLFDQALSHGNHPMRADARAQWRGMLGCVAFASYWNKEGQSLSVRRVALSADPALGLLRDLAPNADQPQWREIALLYWDSSLIGCASPLTLVCPTIRTLSPDVPFHVRGRFVDPGAHFHANGEVEHLQLLHGWVVDLHGRLHRARAELTDFLGFDRPDRLLQELADWAGDLRQLLPSQGAPAPEVVELFPSYQAEQFPASGVLAQLVALAPGSRSGIPEDTDLRLPDDEADVPRVFDPGHTGLLVREDGQRWQGTLTVGRGLSVHVEEGRVTTQQQSVASRATVPPLDRFFTETLGQLANSEAPRAQLLTAENKQFLFPFHPAILEYLSVDELVRYTDVARESAGWHVQVRLPLLRGQYLRWEKTYTLASAITHTPSLAIWPDFASSQWRHYFYHERQIAAADNESRLTLSPVARVRSAGGRVEEEADPEEFQSGAHRWGRSTVPLRAWTASAGPVSGLFFNTPLPPAPVGDAEWTVSVDFGSTNTRVFRRAGSSAPEPVRFRLRTLEVLNPEGSQLNRWFFPVGSSQGPQDFEEFISGVLFPTERSLQDRSDGARWLPADGIAFFPSEGRDLVEKQGRVEYNLKWGTRDEKIEQARRSYLMQILLWTAAEGAAKGIQVRRVRTAYPEVLTPTHRIAHEYAWKHACEAIGLEHEMKLSESRALAEYLKHAEQAPVQQAVIAIDVGGSTADLTIWTNNAPASNDSVHWAGNVMVNAVARQSAVRSALSEAYGTVQPGRSLGWRPSGEEETNILLFLLALKRFSERSAPPVTDWLQAAAVGPSTPVGRLVSTAAYLFAGISYLMGCAAQRNKIPASHFELHFAGRGSLFLRWLDLLGPGLKEELPKRFFRLGLEREAGVSVHLSKSPKEEVGRGLLWAAREYGGEGGERTTFLGEDGVTMRSGEALDWRAELDKRRLADIEQVTDALPRFERFLSGFGELPVLQRVAADLDLGRSTDSGVRGRLVGALLRCRDAARQAGDAHAVEVEPFPIVTARTLLHTVLSARDS